jgi:23S rRNA (cytidine1920-2'-O)/16S rRNA (cytidine1409-2'-O)-methyltransferase
LVTADGVPVRKASDEISSAAVVEATPEHPYVSRGGVKLAAALDHFHLDVTGLICLDVGASTGGFTEVLVRRGARSVYAVDVGHNQLHQRLRGRPDIVSLEATDIRSLDPARFVEPPDLATVDVSFISLKLVVPALDAILKPRAALVALIKPQFEAGRRDIKKGIVRDAAVHATVCDDIAALLVSLGWRVGSVVPSAIRGGDGNREFFIEARRG